MFIRIIVKVQNVRKTRKTVNFEHIFDIFSVQCNWLVLILLALWVQIIKRNPGSFFNHLNANYAKKIEFWDKVKKDIYKKAKNP